MVYAVTRKQMNLNGNVFTIQQWDWDMWMRSNMIRKNRECIIPDISRTYHFGSKGLNMNPYFQEVYFQKHSFVNTGNIKLKDVERYCHGGVNTLNTT